MHYALLNIFLDVYVAKSTQLMRSLIISILFAEGFTLLVVMVFIIIIGCICYGEVLSKPPVEVIA